MRGRRTVSTVGYPVGVEKQQTKVVGSGFERRVSRIGQQPSASRFDGHFFRIQGLRCEVRLVSD